MIDEKFSAEDFNHKISVIVRFHEVDMLGVCNNAVFINYFETARLEYVKAAGLMPGGGIFSDNRLFFIVRNEINYHSHARYDDVLNVYSRISYIKNSSFGFDHLIENDHTKKIIADGKGVVVMVDPATGKSTVLDDKFISKVRAFEKKVQIRRNH
ncbi:MAG: thioesterase family protein [Ignavibacteriaceae bacterium]